MAEITPYRYTVRRLIVLTTAVALAMALSRSLDGPPLFQITIGVYLLVLVL